MAVSDAAGNVGSASPFGTIMFHVLGPPVGVALDASYPSSGDPRSTYAYSFAAGNLATLYDPSAAAAALFPGNAVRFHRYVITNPLPQAVALTPPAFAPNSWVDVEQWDAHADGLAAMVTDAPTLGGRVRVGSLPTVALPGCNLTSAVIFALPGGGCQTSAPLAPGSVVGPQASAPLLTQAYAQQWGVDSAPAGLTARGSWIVPPATGGQPGVLSLYVVRSRSGVVRAAPVPLSSAAQDIGFLFTAPTGNVVPASYCFSYWAQCGTVHTGLYPCCVAVDPTPQQGRGNTLPAGTLYSLRTYSSGAHYYRTAALVQDQLSGQWSPSTFALAGGNLPVEYGELATSNQVFDVTTSIRH